MPDLKSLSREAIPAALEKAERYRLLNEPGEAESICLDILETDPENQPALITLLLALTDRFSKGYGVSDTPANQLLARIKGEYERAYYGGILAERRAKAKLAQEVRARVITPIMNCAKRCGSLEGRINPATGNDDAPFAGTLAPHDGEK
jgi:hypothetical protein